MRLVPTATDNKGITKKQVSQVSSILRNIGVLDEPKRVVHKTGHLVCCDRFKPSVVESVGSDIECSSDSGCVDLNRVMGIGVDVQRGEGGVGFLIRDCLVNL